DVRVEVFQGRECIRTTSTDRMGIARIDSLRPGEYNVRIVNPPGYFVRVIDLTGQDRAPSQGDSEPLWVTEERLSEYGLRFRLRRSPGAPAGIPSRRCARGG
ncbi:MAG TPA: hypothetical protein VHG28_13565, partial [Longimicrobiaceae bacterium]|nr:hypothetical protein [Longimicrobiaceae bacterium]